MQQMKGQGHDITEGPWPKYSIALLSLAEFEVFWPGIEEMLDAVPHTWRHWTKEYILEGVTTGRIQCWGVGPPPKAILCAFSSINIYPAERVFVIDWCAGKFEEGMIPLLDAVWTNYAKLNECSVIEVRGRGGWEPHLRSVGFTREAVVWTRRVPDMRKH